MSHSELIWLKGWAQGREYYKLVKAINFAEQCHEGQFRNDKATPYISHPVRVTTYLINLGVDDELPLVVAMLHDVKEDCGVTLEDLILHFGDKVAEHVLLLSKEKDQSKEDYYKGLNKLPICKIIKLSDRCHNFSTMIGVFKPERIQRYIDETEKHILHLARETRKQNPEFGSAIVVMKQTIEALLDAAKAYLAGVTE